MMLVDLVEHLLDRVLEVLAHVSVEHLDTEVAAFFEDLRGEPERVFAELHGTGMIVGVVPTDVRRHVRDNNVRLLWDQRQQTLDDGIVSDIASQDSYAFDWGHPFQIEREHLGLWAAELDRDLRPSTGRCTQVDNHISRM